MKRDLTSLVGLNSKEIDRLFRVTARLKRERKEGREGRYLTGKILGMIFRKSSTRTRISFEAGMIQLGGSSLFLDVGKLQMDRGESVSDTARVLSSYIDGLAIRTYDQSEVEELSRHATIPIINALTDQYHPCQILTAMFTLWEKRGRVSGLKVAYIGDGNNVAQSWLLGAAIMGIDLTVATPAGYEPESSVVRSARGIATISGAKIELMQDPVQAVAGADVLYTDTWISMGQDDESDIRRAAFQGYRIDSDLLEHANREALVMHCLPAHRGEEITSEVMDGPQSAIWDEAENRLHVQKSLLIWLMGDDGIYSAL